MLWRIVGLRYYPPGFRNGGPAGAFKMTEVVGKVRSKVTELIRSYVGSDIEVCGNEFIGQDIGIIRGDSIEFQDEIEKIFSVDLGPLVHAHAVIPEPGWFDRLLGQNRRAYADFTVDELVRFICKSAS